MYHVPFHREEDFKPVTKQKQEGQAPREHTLPTVCCHVLISQDTWGGAPHWRVGIGGMAAKVPVLGHCLYPPGGGTELGLGDPTGLQGTSGARLSISLVWKPLRRAAAAAPAASGGERTLSAESLCHCGSWQATVSR